MCMNFVYYYPRLEKFTDCRSEVSEEEYKPFFESLYIKYDLMFYVNCNMNFIFLKLLNCLNKIKSDSVSVDFTSLESYYASLASINMTDSIRQKFVNLYEKPTNHTAMCGVNEILFAFFKIYFTIKFDKNTNLRI